MAPRPNNESKSIFCWLPLVVLLVVVAHVWGVLFPRYFNRTNRTTTWSFSRRSTTHHHDNDHHNHSTAAAAGTRTSTHTGPVVNLRSPPMGFMSWERFRCQTDCDTYPRECIHERLYMDMADALVLGGYAAAGYRQVSIDDCWTAGRSSTTGELLQADPHRFPHGIAALADYLHAQGLLLGIYSDAGVTTCAGYAGSQHYEALDATTFAHWGVDYVKYDGCNIVHDNFTHTYTAFGKALQQAASIRPMVYSCSWPAYMGDNESTKPFADMYYLAGCNTWRNFADIDNHWNSLHGIILHWADYWHVLQDALPPTDNNDMAFHDADMLLVGNDHYGQILPLHQAQLQMTFWAMIASPLLISADLRTILPEYQAILLHAPVIAVNQDTSQQTVADCVVGCRTILQINHSNNTTKIATATTRRRTTTPNSSSNVQVWSKLLQGGESHALAFFNLNNDVSYNNTHSGATNDSSTTITPQPINISYTFPVQGAIARCVDLWSHDPEEDLCNQGRGATTQHWNIQLMDDNNPKRVYMQIQAMNVPPTAHRLLRINYFCSTTTTTATTASESL